MSTRRTLARHNVAALAIALSLAPPDDNAQVACVGRPRLFRRERLERLRHPLRIGIDLDPDEPMRDAVADERANGCDRPGDPSPRPPGARTLERARDLGERDLR